MKRALSLAVPLCAGAVLLSSCGAQRDSVAANSPDYRGSVLFAVRCAGCHTLAKAGTRGSGFNVRDKERTNGPNFNVRKESVASVLYAVRNGGFSGAIMPQNIVTGDDALAVARFVSRYAGSSTPKVAAPTQAPASTPGGTVSGSGRSTPGGSTGNAAAPSGNIGGSK